MYISVTDAAAKFSLSKRRVQVLCEQGRIEGANMVSGVWLIPSDAEKPLDARVKQGFSTNQISLFEPAFNVSSSTSEVTLSEVCEILSISTATAKNWVRLGKLDIKENGLFDKSYIENLAYEIKTGKDNRLKSRRNKKSATGKSLYKDYISSENNQSVVTDLLAEYKELSEEELRIILAYFAMQLFFRSAEKNMNLSPLDGYVVSGNKEFDYLIKDLLGNVELVKDKLSRISSVSKYELEYIPTEDTLGFVYISLCDISRRKQLGAYYTPAKTVSALLNNLLKCTDIADIKTVCDPCCGTGNFLISLFSKGIESNHIFGQDIDEISVLIARINLFLRNNNLTRNQLVSQIVCGDTLRNSFDRKFSVVLGNPPWGYEFNKEDTAYLLGNYQTARTKGMESYDLFIEKGLSLIENNGYLAYVLPEALLSVASHAQARKLIVEKASFKFISYLGNAFSAVQCPAVIMGVRVDAKGDTKDCLIQTYDAEFVISENRQIDENSFSFSMTDEEYHCISAISSVKNAKYLENNARFALGIVTGNNKEYIKSVPEQGCEVVLKGSDISRYSIMESGNYIHFVPESFQQVAPTEVYRAKEKLLYRFICDVPVFAYDDKQTLTLNSCNIVIPEIPNMRMKYILAILNSSVAAFYVTKKFNSVKLLRSHIEQIPIPYVSDEVQDGIVKKIDRIMNSSENISGLYTELDNEIMNLFSLPEEMKNTIRLWLNGKNLFLK